MVLADVHLSDIIWSLLWLFFLFIWIMILVQVLIDLFRDHTMGGVAKALWVIALIFLPFITVFVYIIARGSGMAERSMKQQQAAQQQVDSYIRGVDGPAVALPSRSRRRRPCSMPASSAKTSSAS